MNSSLNRFADVLKLSLGVGILGLLLQKYNRKGGFCSDLPEVHQGIMLYGGIGLSLGILAGIAVYNTKYYSHAKYLLNIFIRYGLAYFLIAYGISQILDARYPESLLNQDIKVADMVPGQLVWTFFGYTYAYQAFIGWAQILGCCLLFYRFTTPLGLLILSVILGNALVINYSYDLCAVTDATMFLGIGTYLFLPYLNNFINVTILNKGAKKIEFPVFQSFGHGYKALNILKLVIIVGIMIFHYNPYRRYLRYYQSNADSPIVGVWKIEDIHYDTSIIGSQEEIYLKSFQSLFLERRRLGAVKTKDTLSYFEYMIDTNYHQLEFWNFHNYRSLDLKGKYTLPSPDTLIYKGYNNKDSIEMILTLDKRFKSRIK